MALGVWLLPCQCFPPLQALRAFSSRQGARAATSLLSQPLPPIQYAHTHVDFHFSYSTRLAAPPPQGWLKTGGHTSSSVGGMRAGEKIPEDLFKAAVDSTDESSKRTRGCLGWAVLWSVNLLSTWWPHIKLAPCRTFKSVDWTYRFLLEKTREIFSLGFWFDSLISWTQGCLFAAFIFRLTSYYTLYILILRGH